MCDHTEYPFQIDCIIMLSLYIEPPVLLLLFVCTVTDNWPLVTIQILLINTL